MSFPDTPAISEVLIAMAAATVALGVLWKFPPFAWLRRRIITDPFAEWSSAVTRASLNEVLENGNPINKALAEILIWQTEHAASDLASMRRINDRLHAVETIMDTRTPEFARIHDAHIEMTAKLAELEEYTHRRNHDIITMMTGTKGRVDLLWVEAGHPNTDNDLKGTL